MPNEIKGMVLDLMTAEDVYAFTRTSKDHYRAFRGFIWRRSDPIASTALYREIRRWAFENKLIREKAATERPHIATAECEINYILRMTRRVLQLGHFWLAVELADCSIISRLAKETNIKEEWEEFRDLDLGDEKRQMFDDLLKLSLKPPTNDLADALLDLLKIDKSCNDDKGAHRLTQALLVACRFGNLELVQKLIALGADPEGVLECEWPLMVACNTGKKELFDLLLKSGASINGSCVQASQITTLGAAIKGNNAEIVHHLLDNKVFIQEVNNTIFCHADRLFQRGSDSREQLEIRQMLCERLDIKRAWHFPDIPAWLRGAVKANKLDMMKLLLGPLLEQAADEPTSPPKRWKAYDELLGIALDEQSYDVVDILLDAFPQVFRSERLNILSCKTRAGILDRSMQTGNSALFYPVLSIEDLRKQKENGDTLLHYIREPGAAAELLLLSNYRFGPSGEHITINALSKLDETPLIKACFQNNMQMVEFLLRRNADMEAKDGRGCKYFQVAVEKADVKLVCLLLEYDADIRSGSANIATKLSMAIHHKRWAVLEALLVKGPPVRLSVFERAVEGKGELVEFATLLIRLNKYTEDVARRLLDIVVQDSQVKLSIVERLLEGGADPSPSLEDALEDAPEDAQGYTDKIHSPISWACFHGRKDIAEILFHHGAIVENDEDGTSPSNPGAWTTLQAAVAGGHIEMVLWLLDGKAGISPSKGDRDSWHSLCIVAVKAEIGMLRFLLGRGKAYLSRDSIGDILKEGVQRNQVEIVQYLIEDFGFTKADFDRMHLLHSARQNRRMMKTLQNYGADINF
ncbi:ankyrin 2,3/unc44 [Metarhizium brunneum]